jgi:hypothetical protein
MLPMKHMRIVATWVLFGLAVVAVYLWRSKKVLACDVSAFAAHEQHRFEVLEYRHRPITVWRFEIIGTRSAHAEYTYGATEIQTVPRREWCGNGSGVVIGAVVRYDYGESRLTHVFYNFKTGSLITTLDHRTKDAQIAAALEKCNAE